MYGDIDRLLLKQEGGRRCHGLEWDSKLGWIDGHADHHTELTDMFFFSHSPIECFSKDYNRRRHNVLEHVEVREEKLRFRAFDKKLRMATHEPRPDFENFDSQFSFISGICGSLTCPSRC